MSNLVHLVHFFMYFKMYILFEKIRQMTKITKCPILLDGMNFLIASKSHFLMVLQLNTLCPSLLITLYNLIFAEKLTSLTMIKTRTCYICGASSSVTFKFPVNKQKQKKWIDNLNCRDPLKYGNIGPNVCEGQRLT